MNPHFFTAPFYFAFIWFRVRGSRLSWRLRRLFLEDGILVSQPSPLGNAIKLSGRTFLAPHRGNAVKLSKILIAHASNSVCFFHPLSLLVNNKIKKLVK